MALRSQKPDPPQFGNLFNRWRAIVELFANDASGQDDLDDTEYRTLHGTLMGICRRARVEDGANEPQDQQIRHLETLIAPWLDLEAFRQAPAIIKDVLVKCDACPMGRAHPTSQTRTSTWTIVGFGLLFCAVFAVLLGGDLLTQVQHWLFGIGNVQDSVYAMWDTIVDNRGHSASWLMGIAVVGFTGLVTYAVFRPPRSY